MSRKEVNTMLYKGKDTQREKVAQQKNIRMLLEYLTRKTVYYIIMQVLKPYGKSWRGFLLGAKYPLF